MVVPTGGTRIRLEGSRIFTRLAIVIFVVVAAAFGAAAGLLFVYSSDLPQVGQLEDYRPDVVTELYGDDGQPIGSFALQRRILLTYDQIPPLLRKAILVTEDQHFEEHWGVDLPRVVEAAIRNITAQRKAEGASTLTMQLARVLFLTPEKSFRRKIEETLLAIQIERHYTKEQIFTMYCNQIYLAHGNYGFEAASEFYFGKPVAKLTPPEAALLAGIIRGPSYSPVLHPQKALDRRNLVLGLMARDGIITRAQAQVYSEEPLDLNVSLPQNGLAPYFIEEIRQYLERTYGTEAVHQQGLRVYTTLNPVMQRAADQAVADGLDEYDRRHGWRGNLSNVLRDHIATLDSYQAPDWRDTIQPGSFVTALVLSVDSLSALLKIGSLHVLLSPPDFAWTGHHNPSELLAPGDLAMVHIVDISGTTAKVQLEQKPAAQAALIAIENSTGEIKAMVGGYSFEESKFNRATQAMRQTGSSFKVYVYAAALEQGMSPFDTVDDSPFSVMSGGQTYSPHNYDNKYEGRITLRRALADSRNVPAVRVAAKVGIENVVDMARRFGISSPLPPYLPLALGAADLTLFEHTSAFTVFPDDGIHIAPHMIRRVTTYDGATLEDARPQISDVIHPEVARTMTAMLEDVVQFGTGVRAKELGVPTAGKTGTTNDFTDAWYIGFTSSLTAGVWVGNDDKRISLGKKETGARAALPIWLEFMKSAVKVIPAQDFENVVPLEKQAATHQVRVDTPDTAPPADAAEQGLISKPQGAPLTPSSAKPVSSMPKPGVSYLPIPPSLAPRASQQSSAAGQH
jgi:penicillin-binding protein 1A